MFSSESVQPAEDGFDEGTGGVDKATAGGGLYERPRRARAKRTEDGGGVARGETAAGLGFGWAGTETNSG